MTGGLLAAEPATTPQKGISVTERDTTPSETPAETTASASTSSPPDTQATPTLAEDLLLLLFQPASGTIGGENTLFYALGGAVLAELALAGRVEATDPASAQPKLRAVDGAAPTDPLVRAGWEYVAQKPRSGQALIAAIGPTLREPVITRLLDSGHLSEREHKAMGIFTTTRLTEGSTGRRAQLVTAVRDALTTEHTPEPRIAALTGLLFASGVMPQLDPEIPWNSTTYAAAEQYLRGNRGSTATAEAVARTVAASILAVTNFVVTTSIAGRE